MRVVLLLLFICVPIFILWVAYKIFIIPNKDKILTDKFRIIESRPNFYQAQRRNLFGIWIDWDVCNNSSNGEGGYIRSRGTDIEKVQEFVTWWMKRLKKEEKEKRFRQRTIKEWD